MLSHLDPSFVDDPHPTWDAMRAADPVSWVPEIDAWVLTGNDVVREALRHPSLSPSVRYWKHHEPPDAGRDQLTPQQRFHSSGLFNVTPGDHVRLRRLINRAFTPRGVGTETSFTVDLVDRLMAAHEAGEVIDLHTEVFEQIPVQVISNLVGFPPEFGDTFKAASDTLILTLEPLHDEDTDRRIDAAILEIEAMIRATVDERRTEPADDLLSRMIEVSDDGDRLSFDEMVALVLGLVIAGSGTTANLMSVSAHDLLADRQQWLDLVERPDRLPGAIEELLRFTTLGFGAPRFTIEDLVLGGHDIAAGDLLFCSLPAANHDPAAFTDPHRLDITREPSAHLAFSIGPHYCLGANLARLEITTALAALIDRFPAIEPAGEPTWELTFLFRNLQSLPVRL